MLHTNTNTQCYDLKLVLEDGAYNIDDIHLELLKNIRTSEVKQCKIKLYYCLSFKVVMRQALLYTYYLLKNFYLNSGVHKRPIINYRIYITWLVFSSVDIFFRPILVYQIIFGLLKFVYSITFIGSFICDC